MKLKKLTFKIMDWNNEIRNRLDSYQRRYNFNEGFPISLKVGVYSGCFHREHSPKAYELIDRELHTIDLEKEKIQFIEHESGPEILLWVLAITGALNFSTSVINLIVSIIKARSEGIKKGDRSDAP
ncbi:MAG: hypothetical protein K8I03_14330, partial [Ignavibacteria bacterium]|nr:hypothetical protein [Ignavibacteria bacterium]